MTVPVPSPRWGVRFTSNPDRDLDYLQQEYDENPSSAKRGELFLNEPNAELYYVDGSGEAKVVGSQSPVSFNRIDFTGIREFDNDEDASEATPPVAVGGLYHTSGVLKVRLV